MTTGQPTGEAGSIWSYLEGGISDWRTGRYLCFEEGWKFHRVGLPTGRWEDAPSAKGGAALLMASQLRSPGKNVVYVRLCTVFPALARLHW